MSVVIEEVFDDDQPAQHFTGLVHSDDDSSLERVDSFHDASEATSDDEWQDVTEHFDASALPGVAPPQAVQSAHAPPDSQPSLDPHQTSHPAPTTHAAPDGSSASFQAGGSSPGPDSPPSPGTTAQIQTENQSPTLPRPPDDFWDNARSSPLRSEEYSVPLAAADAAEDSCSVGQELPDGTAVAPQSEEIEVLTAEETEVLYKLQD